MKKRMKKAVAVALSVVMAMGLVTGCKKKGNTFDASKAITVVSRESGSGTRGAFIELLGIEEKNEAGEKVDNTIDTAITTNNTAVMMTTVAGDVHAIGYISLGSLNDTVKAVKIEGVEATVENIKNGSYEISRPFNIATKAEISDLAQDFISFILSKEGQAVVEKAGYIAVDGAESYTSSNPKGTKIVVAGSSSVTPVMEKLKEAYMEINPNITITIQENDSSTGMQSTISGTCDIGMASRELKDSEIKEGITGTQIAIDGIAVITNNKSDVEDLTKEQVKNIYTGKSTVWSDVLK